MMDPSIPPPAPGPAPRSPREAPAWALPQWVEPDTRPGGLVVGSDGRPETAVPMRVASALANRDGSAVHVVAALSARPMLAPGFDVAWTSPETTRRLEQERHHQVRGLIESVTGTADTWTVQLRDGLPGALLATAATERRARMIVIGLGLRRLRDRLLGGENVLRIMRHAPVPVLAVHPDATGLPHSAVVAMDFSRASVRAAREALALLGERGTLYLVHVRPPREYTADEPPPEGDVYPDVLDAWFARLKCSLNAPPDVIVRPVILRGTPAEEALDFARRVRADLIAAGTQGTTLVERFLVGSVSTAIVRGAGCSVLVTPADTSTVDAPHLDESRPAAPPG